MPSFLRLKNRKRLVFGTVVPREYREDVDRTEAEKVKRANRAWLRERDESNVPEFERERQEGDELLDWAVGNGWE